MIEFNQSTALIVIDVQKGMDDPRMGARNNPQAEANIARLITAWRQSGRPIFHVAHDSTEPNSPFRPEVPGNAFKSEAEPMPGEAVYRKRVNSAFIGTSLEVALRFHKVVALVIAGLTTNHCVSTTVRMAGNLDFPTFVVADATAAFDRVALDGRLRAAEEVHQAALSDLHEEFATVVDTDTVLRALTGSQSNQASSVD